MREQMGSAKLGTLAVAALTVVALAFPAAAPAGTEGRISGEIMDPAGQPLEGVQVTVSAVGLDIHRQAETNKKGKFTITVLNASRDYTIRLEKEGFQSFEEPIDTQVGATIKPRYTMSPGETITPEKLAELESKDKSAKLYNEGVKLFSTGDIDGAAEMFRQSLVEDAELGLAHLALARIYLARNEDEAALPHAEKTNELVPDEDMSQVVLFDALWGVGEFERALPLLDRMIADGKETEKVAVRSYNAAVHAVKANDWDGARARFETALELDSTLVPAHLTLAQITLNQGDYAASINHAQAYVAAEPDNAKGLSILYQAHLRAGDEAAAQAAFDQMSAADPDMVAETFFEEGINHFNAGRNAEAMSAFEKVLRAQADHPQAHYYLGLSSASNGDIPKAREYLGRFIELAPEDPEAPTAREMLAGLK